MKTDIRWLQRFENYSNSFLFLKKSLLQESFSELERAGILQSFEMTFELAWKVMKDYLNQEGYQVKSPRETIKQAFQNSLITDGEAWLSMLQNRNLLSHVYDEATSLKIVEQIQLTYYELLDQLFQKLEQKSQELNESKT